MAIGHESSIGTSEIAFRESLRLAGGSAVGGALSTSQLGRDGVASSLENEGLHLKQRIQLLAVAIIVCGIEIVSRMGTNHLGRPALC